MQKLCCVCTIQQPLPDWIIVTSLPNHISINSRPFPVGIVSVIHTTPRKINIVGIDDHELTGLNVVTAAALLDTQKGPIIGVFHEYAHLGKGRSIHAAGQMEWFNCQV